MGSPTIPTFQELTAAYINSGEHNDAVFRDLTQRTWNDPVLSRHRRYIESNKLGFGDAAFHSMWLTLLLHAHRQFGEVRALEIGVYKGQIISLWSLIAKHLNIPIKISAITPLVGAPAMSLAVLHKLRIFMDRRYRESHLTGSLYPKDDYLKCIQLLFEEFALSMENVTLLKGYSTDLNILQLLREKSYHIVYVDGDHTYGGALHDFIEYGPKVVRGGWLVADDAGANLPGSAFWKGIGAVSQAANVLPTLGFKNILNIGHNRIYERIEA